MGKIIWTKFPLGQPEKLDKCFVLFFNACLKIVEGEKESEKLLGQELRGLGTQDCELSRRGCFSPGQWGGWEGLCGSLTELSKSYCKPWWPPGFWDGTPKSETLRVKLSLMCKPSKGTDHLLLTPEIVLRCSKIANSSWWKKRSISG